METKELITVEQKIEKKQISQMTIKEVVELTKDYFSKEETERFESEKLFALQAINDNSYTKNIATKNPVSLIKSLSILAKSNLTLNPTMKLAYLVPSEGKDGKNPKIELRVSYLGLLRGLFASRIIKNCQVESICEGDLFDYELGTSAFIKHKKSLIKRGNIIGFYCIITLQDNEKMIEIMNTEEVNRIRNIAKTDIIWSAHYEEMGKKTIIKRIIKKIPVLPENVYELIENDNTQDFDFNKTEVKEEKKQIDDIEFIEE